MKRRIKKDIVLILLGVAIVAIPFLLRMKEQERSNRYMKAFEEEQNEEIIKRKIPFYCRRVLSGLLKYRA